MSMRMQKKNYSWNPRKCICENSSKYLKIAADTSVTKSDKIVIFMNILSTKRKYYGNRCHEYCFNKLR